MTDIQYSFKKKMMAWILSICLIVTLIPNVGYATGIVNDGANDEASSQSTLNSREIISETEAMEDDVIKKRKMQPHMIRVEGNICLFFMVGK